MTYNWKITGMKFVWAAAEVLVAGLLAYFTDNNYFLALVPILEAARNYIKHR